MEQQINFTQSALSQVKQLFEGETRVVPDDAIALRIFVAGGGCSGFQYGFAPATEDDITDDDYRFDQDGASFVVDPLSMMYLEGSTVDFKQDIMAQQFTITNPNVMSECGCGNSFSA